MGFNEDIFNFAKDGELYGLKFYLQIDNYTKQERSSAVSSYTKGATPLLIACKNGHFDVVRYLIEKWNVDIEKAGTVTFHGKKKFVTPIWCAAAAGHLNIVKLLVKYNASVISTACNETVLHAACFDGHLDTVKYLVQHGANLDSNSCNITPLLLAAVKGHSEIVNFFFSAFNCTKEEKIDALELLGATVINKKLYIETALKYWKKAMEMRFEDGEPALRKPCCSSALAKYMNTTEVNTFQDLEMLISDPDIIKLQSLLIRDRILGQSHPSNVQEIKLCANSFNIGISIKLWIYILDSVYDEPFSDETYETIENITELFYRLMTANSLNVTLPVPVPPISFIDVMHVFQRCLKEFERYLSSSGIEKDINKKNNFNNVLILSMHLLYIMCKIQPRLNTNEDTELKKAAYKLVYLNPKTIKCLTPLHLACVKQLLSHMTYPTPPYKFDTFEFPSPEIVDLLLEVGACPNAVDVLNNTPLHITAKNRPCAPSIFKALLNHGAHLDFCNFEKKTPLQLAGNTSFLDIYPLHYTTLKCLSAKIIRKHKIAYEGVVHEALKTFLDSH